MTGSSGERFAREELLIGTEAMGLIKGSHVAVFGIGGVGSFCAETLARAGVGELTFVDSDTVQPSNSNRQLVALQSTMGKSKAEVMAKRAADINPDVRVHAVKAWFDEESADALLSARYDYVADAIDSVESKLLLIVRCKELGIPVVSSMGAGNKTDATGFLIADISKTHTCPLAKVIRTGLRKKGIEDGVTVVFSESKPERVAPGPPGSISFVPPVAGLLMAQVVIRGLIGDGKQGMK